MGTATLSEDTALEITQESAKIPDLTKKILRGSERFWLSSGVLFLIYASTHLPTIGPQQSLLDRTQHSPTIVNTNQIPLPASEGIKQNYLTIHPPVYTITTEVNEQFLQFQNEKEAIKRTLSKRNLIELAVADPRSGIPKDKQPLAVEWMLRTIFIESKGHANAYSETAYGLAQVIPDTANWEAQNINLINYDPNNEYHNVLIGTTYWWRQFNRYGLELTPLAYNFGPENVKTALQVYSKKTKSPLTYITAEQLLNDPDVIKEWKRNKVPEKAIKEAKLYVTRFKAAGLLALGEKPTALPQTKG